MPNPTSKLNLVINGVTTQLDIHDANAVDLTNNQTVAGDKEFTGTTTAHDVIPSATDTYNFGSSSAQWNNAYIKSLTINGVACGDILTHNASEFVDVTTAQTIGGNKTFSGTIEFTSSPKVKRTSDPFYNLTTTGYDKGTNPSSNLYSGIRFFSNPNGTAQNNITGGLDMVYYESGYNAIGLNVRNYDENSNHRFFTVALRVSNDSTIPVDFVPSVNALINLGSSKTYWKDCYTKAINGINPGALSLPSISASGANAWIALDTTNWVASLATSTAQKYMPPSDGWLNVRVDNAVALGLALTDGGNYMHQMVRSETPAGLALLLPVFKGKEVAILVGGNENFAYTRVTFYPCQGNV